MKSYPERLAAYIDAITQLFPGLPVSEQQSFFAWRALPTSKRDSDWPGWGKFLGSKPSRITTVLRMDRSA